MSKAKVTPAKKTIATSEKKATPKKGVAPKKALKLGGVPNQGGPTNLRGVPNQGR